MPLHNATHTHPTPHNPHPLPTPPCPLPQALTPLTIGRNRFAASALGALWGFGHSTGQLILGLVFVVLKVGRVGVWVCVLGAHVFGQGCVMGWGPGVRDAEGDAACATVYRGTKLANRNPPVHMHSGGVVRCMRECRRAASWCQLVVSECGCLFVRCCWAQLVLVCAARRAVRRALFRCVTTPIPDG